MVAGMACSCCGDGTVERVGVCACVEVATGRMFSAPPRPGRKAI